MPTMYHANGEHVEAADNEVESWEECGWSTEPPKSKRAAKADDGDEKPAPKKRAAKKASTSATS